MSIKKVYLAGPMRGSPQFNYTAFKAGAEFLRAQGFEVFSPAENDIAKFGAASVLSNATGDHAESEAKFGLTIRKALGDDLAWICAEADAVYLLPGWENSKGAKAEKATAEAIGIEVNYIAANGQ